MRSRTAAADVTGPARAKIVMTPSDGCDALTCGNQTQRDALPPAKSQCHLCVRSGQGAIQFRVIELACYDNQAVG
jgi:hypothetical protein